MKTISCFLIILVLYSLTTTTSINCTSIEPVDMTPLVFPKGSTYEEVWKDVQKFEEKNLAKSALSLVEAIYKQAKSDTNYAQIVKSIIYKQKYKVSLEENAYQMIVDELSDEIDSSGFPLKPVLHGLLADVYWSFYQNNRWRYYNRTQTVGFKSDDINTWDVNHIVDEVTNHYALSLQNTDSLKRTQLGLYDDILVVQLGSKKYRPTLYDFLAHRSIDFFSNSESGLTKPAGNFIIDKGEYFLPAKEFADLTFETDDTLSLKLFAMTQLRNLLEFHLEDDSVDALIDVDLKRLGFVYQNSIHPQRDSLYLDALQQLEKTHISTPASAEVSYRIALVYQAKGARYQPLVSDENKWMVRKAFEYCDEVMKRHPGSFGAVSCEQLRKVILDKTVSFNIAAYNQGSKNALYQILHKNLSEVHFRLIKIDRHNHLNDIYDKYGDELLEYFSKLEFEKQWTVALKNDGDYQNHLTEVAFPELEFGYYLILASPTKDFPVKKNLIAYSYTQITNMAYTQRKSPDFSYDFYAYNRETGSPLKGISVSVWREKYSYILQKYQRAHYKNFKTDKDGHFHMPATSGDGENYYVEFIDGKDHLYSNNAFYQYKPYYNEPYKYNVTNFFTDREIYRPGQTLHFKGIVMETFKGKYTIVPNFRTTVYLYDVNQQISAQMEVTSNEYGSISGMFTIPQGVVSGQMYITNYSGSKYFSVEEYKRPKFEAEFEPVKGSYKLNEKITLKGNAKAYAGSNIDGAEVKYQVKRIAYFPYRWFWYSWFSPTSAEAIITYGNTTTDENGDFTFDFDAIPDASIKSSWYPYFVYTASADITDINGETHSASHAVTVGYTALTLVTDFSDMVNRNTQKTVTISTTNLNGEFNASKGKITIYRLKENDKLFNSRLFSQPDQHGLSKEEFGKIFPHELYSEENSMNNLKKAEKVLEKDFDTSDKKELNLDNCMSWKQGRYIVELLSKDIYGTTVEFKQNFTLYDPDEKKVAINEIAWFVPVKNMCEPGEKAKFLIGSADTNVLVLFEIELKEKIIHQEWITLNKSQQMIEIPVEEAHRGNFSVHFVIIKHDREYIYSELVTVPYTNKELDVSFETFRNKLYPGEKEEWRMKIKGKKGEKIAAEMLATLYDASLDAFRPNNWFFDIYQKYYTSLYWQGTAAFSTSFSTFVQNDWTVYHYVNYRYYDQLNWFGFYYGGYNYYWDYRAVTGGLASADMDISGSAEGMDNFRGDMLEACEQTVSRSTAASPMSRSLSTVSDGEGLYDKKDFKKSEKQKDTYGKRREMGVDDDGRGYAPVQVRKNFSETAFFYPQLETNSEGEVIIKFTVPEALTKWKMMGFAHTKDLMFGLIENELITQKDLMLMPNVPRFLRENDEIRLSAKISNISKDDLSGKAELLLFDALTMKPVDVIFENTSGQKPFSVKAGQSVALTWKINVPEGVQALTYRFTAQTPKFSDGEENTIPVLTNRMLVTESMPLPIRSNQTKEFEFRKLINSAQSSTLKHHKLTLEFTANPAWYAVQALPYMIEYPYECAEQTFSRYYGNSIAAHLANSSPKIKSVFDSWKNTTDSKALLSNLEKNQELKSLLLEETPWVLDAKDENERKHRLALLFDLHHMSSNLNSAKRKLMKLQALNGGWVWFQGGPDDRYMTQHIITGFGHLDQLGVKDIRSDYQVWQMVTNGVSYLDNEIRKVYKELKKYYTNEELKKDHISYEQIQYLYARSCFKDIPIPSATQEAFDYFTGQAKKYWTQKSTYMQGMIALGLHRYGDKETPMEIIRSLREIAQVNDEMGMYWKENNGGYYWYQAPIETHALLTEAFDEILNDKKVTDDLRVWLLKQKQVQDWKTTKATTEAVFVLLKRGTDWLATSSAIEIMVGDIVIDPVKMPEIKEEAGTGYFKIAWNEDEVKPKMGKVKVTKKDQGVSWGALYWQYFEQLDKITPHETPLSLKKELFKEIQASSGKVIEPIKNKGSIKVGDKVIVRIELRVDRSMEYVHMKDMRASCFEPLNVISQYKYQDGLGYYESTKDVSANFFFDRLPKGTYVFEYSLWTTHTGDFSNGITTIQCMYAPEFTSHSEGVRVKVAE